MSEKCFGMSEDGKCDVLREKECPGNGRCAFYKSQPRFQRDQELANTHLSALTPIEQAYIAEKYYDGDMPWKGGNGEARGETELGVRV